MATARVLVTGGAILITVVGAQFISMGLLAEIQIRTYHESSHRPIYTIREILNPYDPETKDTDRATEARW